MRVPSIGLPLDERLIVREAYAYAERMLRGYEDPPSFADRVAKRLVACRRTVLDLYRTILRG